MRKTISIILATAGIAIASPAIAQESMPPQDDTFESAPDAGTVPGLTPEQQSALESWPAETQEYYLTLSPDRQALFWQLSDPDKVAISQLPREQQDATWAALQERAMGAPAPAGPANEPTGPDAGNDQLDDGFTDEAAPAEPMG
ncbi:hypothetical protein [Alteriqipengyuania sp. 357]